MFESTCRCRCRSVVTLRRCVTLLHMNLVSGSRPRPHHVQFVNVLDKAGCMIHSCTIMVETTINTMPLFVLDCPMSRTCVTSVSDEPLAFSRGRRSWEKGLPLTCMRFIFDVCPWVLTQSQAHVKPFVRDILAARCPAICCAIVTRRSPDQECSDCSVVKNDKV